MALVFVIRTVLLIATPMLLIQTTPSQHVYATNLNVGRNPKDTLRVLDASAGQMSCALATRDIGGATLVG